MRVSITKLISFLKKKYIIMNEQEIYEVLGLLPNSNQFGHDISRIIAEYTRNLFPNEFYTDLISLMLFRDQRVVKYLKKDWINIIPNLNNLIVEIDNITVYYLQVVKLWIKNIHGDGDNHDYDGYLTYNGGFWLRDTSAYPFWSYKGLLGLIYKTDINICGEEEDLFKYDCMDLFRKYENYLYLIDK
jgi:hypothetical protein